MVKTVSLPQKVAEVLYTSAHDVVACRYKQLILLHFGCANVQKIVRFMSYYVIVLMDHWTTETKSRLHVTYWLMLLLGFLCKDNLGSKITLNF